VGAGAPSSAPVDLALTRRVFLDAGRASGGVAPQPPAVLQPGNQPQRRRVSEVKADAEWQIAQVGRKPMSATFNGWLDRPGKASPLPYRPLGSARMKAA
jgi:hypothetical protein